MCVYIRCNTQIVRLYIYSYGIICIITQIYLRHLFYGTSVSQVILATFRKATSMVAANHSSTTNFGDEFEAFEAIEPH